MVQRILSWLLALLFVASGVPKVIGVAQVAEGFEKLGYSASFRILIGVLEAAGGIALLVPAVALYGNALLIAIMIGAIWTVISAGQSVAPPIVVGALLVVLAILRERRARGA